MLTLAWVGERRRPDLGQVFWPDRGFSKGRARAGDCKESAASSRYYCGREIGLPTGLGVKVRRTSLSIWRQRRIAMATVAITEIRENFRNGSDVRHVSGS